MLVQESDEDAYTAGLKCLPSRNPLSDPGASTPQSVRILGPPDSAINLPIALKNAISMKSPRHNEHIILGLLGCLNLPSWFGCIEVTFLSTSLCHPQSILYNTQACYRVFHAGHVQNNLLGKAVNIVFGIEPNPHWDVFSL